MVRSLLSATHSGLNMVKDINQFTELPQLTFNKMCFGFIHNDWVVVASSLTKLMISSISLLIVLHSRSV